MAFHVACPITCRRICFCSLGFRGEVKNEFLDEVARLEEFLKDPWLLKFRDKGTVRVAVPKVVAPPPPAARVGEGGVRDGNELLLSEQTKRGALKRKASVALLVAGDNARRFECRAVDVQDSSKDCLGEDQGQSNGKVMCLLCYSGENEGSERARKMLSCKSCAKKYHRSCLKAWAQHRDLFHWSLWTCPSCRICEVCRKTGDQTRFMFCKRCDGAHHCHCQQPSHKNVSSGPYLCPKHTRCHSCGSTVPGNGPSTRWFLGHTCCDACGRLFVKGNYCPVCLKVYRESESTPMVCCDVCQRWVHCQCDGISDEKYLQFQVDGNLKYNCAACRGECHQVRDFEDAVLELWKRRDKADSDLISSLRAAAGLPTQEEIFSISPYSDDEESGPTLLKNEYSRSLKFSFKGTMEKPLKKIKEHGKKSSKKKCVKKEGDHLSLISKSEAHQSFEGHSASPSFGYSGDVKQSHQRGKHFSSPIAGSLSEGICSINQAGIVKRKFNHDVTVGFENKKSQVIQVSSTTPHGLGVGDDSGKDARESNTTNSKGPKLVIHIGARNRTITRSPRSEASSYQSEQELTACNGEKADFSGQLKGPKLRGKEGNLIKIKKISSEDSDMKPKFSGGHITDSYESVSPVKPQVSSRKTGLVETAAQVPAIRGDQVYSRKNVTCRPEVLTAGNNDGRTPSGSNSLPRDSKPLLKFKFKNLYQENQSSSAPPGGDEKSPLKGQRSKRKRPSPSGKSSAVEDEDASQCYGSNTMSEMMDANWILQKLGEGAIGKRVEIQEPSNNSWRQGVINNFIEGTSTIAVALDDGRAKNLELGKQGIRFVSQKQKR